MRRGPQLRRWYDCSLRRTPAVLSCSVKFANFVSLVNVHGGLAVEQVQVSRKVQLHCCGRQYPRLASTFVLQTAHETHCCAREHPVVFVLRESQASSSCNSQQTGRPKQRVRLAAPCGAICNQVHIVPLEKCVHEGGNCLLERLCLRPVRPDDCLRKRCRRAPVEHDPRRRFLPSSKCLCASRC